MRAPLTFSLLLAYGGVACLAQWSSALARDETALRDISRILRVAQTHPQGAQTTRPRHNLSEDSQTPVAPARASSSTATPLDAGSTVPAPALPPEMADCKGAAIQAAVAACTRVIDERRVSRDVLVTAYANRAATYFQRGDDTRAIADLDQAIRLDPRNYQAISLRAQARARQGDFVRAIADVTSTLSLRPDEAAGLRARGSLHQRKGDTVAAFADFDAALRVNPDDAETLQQRAALYLAMNRLDQARRDADRSLEIRAQSAASLMMRAEIRSRQGDQAGALVDLDAALRIEPGNADLRKRRDAIGAPTLQPVATAVDNPRARLDQAIARDPNNAVLLMQRAQSAWAVGDIQRTILDLNEVIRRQSRNGEAFRIRGLAHARRGDAVRTINDLTQAINLDVRDANTYLFRAEAYVRHNDRRKAIADYRQVLRIEPGNRFAINGLRRFGLNK